MVHGCFPCFSGPFEASLQKFIICSSVWSAHIDQESFQVTTPDWDAMCPTCRQVPSSARDFPSGLPMNSLRLLQHDAQVVKSSFGDLNVQPSPRVGQQCVGWRSPKFWRRSDGSKPKTIKNQRKDQNGRTGHVKSERGATRGISSELNSPLRAVAHYSRGICFAEVRSLDHRLWREPLSARFLWDLFQAP